MSNLVVANLKTIVVDIIGDFLYWPIWWYSTGAKNVFLFLVSQVEKTWDNLALSIWVVSLFKPMFGDRSILGRLISLGVRVVVLIWRLIRFLMWTGIVLVIFAAWFIAPVFVVVIILSFLEK